MASVEAGKDGEIDVAALLRKVNMMEVSIEMKAGVHEIAQVRELCKNQASSINKLDIRVGALEKACKALEH
jgi:DNA-binding Xre family transcriptional regulator